MTIEQMELFKDAVDNRKVVNVTPSNGVIDVDIDGKHYKLTMQDIDALEHKFGLCENEDGVSFFWLLRRLAADGAKHIKLV